MVVFLSFFVVIFINVENHTHLKQLSKIFPSLHILNLSFLPAAVHVIIYFKLVFAIVAFFLLASQK